MHRIISRTFRGGQRPWGRSLLLAVFTVCVGACSQLPQASAPRAVAEGNELVPLADVAPDVLQDMRYHGAANFMGRPVAGYLAPRCWLSQPAARAMRAVQNEVVMHGLSLKVFDCYRPQTAVNDFVRWGRDLADQKTKSTYYPRVPKEELFRLGYVAEKSGHSRASTVDLTLVVTNPARAREVLAGASVVVGQEVDMGTPFDLFDERSHTDAASVSPAAQHNRRWLRAVMERHGWRNLPEEWWHFTLRDEPFPDRYFDDPVR